MTIAWSISVSLSYKTSLEAKISSTQDFFEVSFDLNYLSELKFIPSLFPVYFIILLNKILEKIFNEKPKWL